MYFQVDSYRKDTDPPVKMFRNPGKDLALRIIFHVLHRIVAHIAKITSVKQQNLASRHLYEEYRLQTLKF